MIFVGEGFVVIEVVSNMFCLDYCVFVGIGDVVGFVVGYCCFNVGLFWFKC